MIQQKHSVEPKLLILNDTQLASMSTERLIAHLSSVRAVISSIDTYYGWRCCELCHEYIGEDWENDVAKYSRPFKVYMVKLKGILAARPHISRVKTYHKTTKARLLFKPKAKSKKIKRKDLWGNR